MTSFWLILKAVRHCAIICPACSAVMSKATPIFAALSAKASSSFLAIPAWPAAATISAKPLAVIGIRWERAKISSPISLNCCGVSKSMTLRTSAIADSKSTASFTGTARVAPAVTAPSILLRILDWKASALPCNSIALASLFCACSALANSAVSLDCTALYCSVDMAPDL